MTINRTAILGCLFAAVASASSFSYDTADRGYYYNYDYNLPSNQNYSTGQLNLDPTSAINFNSFFGFSALSGLDGPITSATLYLFNPDDGYSDTNATETLTITEFTGDVTALETANGQPGGGIVAGEFSALASGTVFGTATVSAADDGNFVAITLNADAIAFLNANSSSAFAFGGSLGTFADFDTHFVFGGSNDLSATDGDTYLSVVTTPSSTSPVPEPSMLFLVLPALAGLMVVRRKRSAA